MSCPPAVGDSPSSCLLPTWAVSRKDLKDVPRNLGMVRVKVDTKKYTAVAEFCNDVLRILKYNNAKAENKTFTKKRYCYICIILSCCTLGHLVTLPC